MGSLPYSTNTLCNSHVRVLHTGPLLHTHIRTDPGACTLLDRLLATLAPFLLHPGHVIFATPPFTVTSNKVRAWWPHPQHLLRQTGTDSVCPQRRNQWVRMARVTNQMVNTTHTHTHTHTHTCIEQEQDRRQMALVFFLKGKFPACIKLQECPVNACLLSPVFTSC